MSQRPAGLVVALIPLVALVAGCNPAPAGSAAASAAPATPAATTPAATSALNAPTSAR